MILETILFTWTCVLCLEGYRKKFNYNGLLYFLLSIYILEFFFHLRGSLGILVAERWLENSSIASDRHGYKVYYIESAPRFWIICCNWYTGEVYYKNISANEAAFTWVFREKSF